MKLQHRKSILLFRHGSRAPSKPAYDLFSQNPLVQQQWKVEQGVFLDDLTETGKEQSRILGSWTREYLQEKSYIPSTVSMEMVEWKSSAVQRVIDSGAQFWFGFFQTETTSLTPKSYNEPDSIFRSWLVHKDYIRWTDDEKKSDSFIQKAEESWPFIQEILQALQLKGIDRLPKPMVLYGMTFAREMIDCERYYDSPVLAFQQQLSPNQIETIDQLARWCWNARFFKHPFIEQLGYEIYTELKTDILNAGQSESEPLFTLYSVHDYTILIVLASFGITSYDELFSFCAFLLIDVFDKTDENGSVSRVFTITLNPTPFENNQRPEKQVQTQNLREIRCENSQTKFWSLQ